MPLQCSEGNKWKGTLHIPLRQLNNKQNKHQYTLDFSITSYLDISYKYYVDGNDGYLQWEEADNHRLQHMISTGGTKQIIICDIWNGVSLSNC